MASWDTVAEELLCKVSSLDTDVRFRSLVLQQQCESLQAICKCIRDLETSLVEETTTQEAETLAVEQSIQDAIRRARQVRAELTAKDDSSDDEQKGPLDAEEQQLQSILAIAKVTRTAQSFETLEQKLEPMPRIRLEYPRKLKALETQLEELLLKEKEVSTRFAFCCKMSEHLSLSPQRKQLIQQQQQKFGSTGRMDVPVARIQMSFPKQVVRLRHGYQRLMEFVLEKIEVGSPHFQHVADAPTFSSVFPIYHRLKQAKKLLRLLNSEARAMLERLPASPPKLSAATAAHRDAMLARIRRKNPRPHVGGIRNEALQVAALKAQSHLHADKELLEKLQAAWAARALAATEETEAHRFNDVYSTTVREIVLTELSNIVLWSFKTYFADTAEQPDASQVEAVMRLVRLVDSIALSQGRAYRTVVAPH
ncbi:hypothetical protein JG687_00007133 [Phytophthora cactorum]|uniref:Uncharacterized protein n=1 Tax=Phytophthora cactorum TaxID=29920 RepID=A0A329T3F7_9STRA|nr:hypothetical protein Pcac1_g10519 [Phytophthora cactorum]KAG2795797.1 hypothetical protein PC112_g22486 [Phytophthora cactorum]KAG2812115.1 hypothetical protein PC111_g14951 [Phytophthora cactorum]KAG2851349.1 hypothetical protein PC113_g16000 [Phytophthora cactorum]KAG2903116.1 hypothetical protein PC115_g15424 [Phytophthora cactorum]